MKEYAFIISAVVAVAIGGLWVAQTYSVKSPGQPGGRACTMEAMLCPDGSAVGRTGPDCEFAACPDVQATSTPSTTTGEKGISPSGSGVLGTVMLGPTCPVMRDPPDPQCADKPYATTIVAHRTGTSATFATGESDASGAFSLSLPPGSYTLTAGGGKMLPRCSPTDVTVVKGGYSAAAISCDSGIR